MRDFLEMGDPQVTIDVSILSHGHPSLDDLGPMTSESSMTGG
jgi:hypothetical protein